MTEPGRQGYLAAATAGVASVVLGAGLGELTAGVIAPTSSPFAAIGGALIDSAPPWAKDAAIDLFGTADKTALLVGIGIVLIAVAAGAGVLQRRLPPWGAVVVLALGAAGTIAAMTRTGAGMLAFLPSVVAGVVGAVVLRWLVARLALRAPARAEAPAGPRAEGPSDPERRRFFAWAGAAAAAGVFAAVAGNAIRGGYRAVSAARDAVRLPRPATPAAPVPAAAELGIPDLSPIVTPNTDFYRIDTALIVPQVDPSTWQLRIHGLVDREVTLTWEQLLALPLEESVTTLTCVSNEVGGGLIGNAMWLGYPIRELLAQAGPHKDADMVLSTSVDGFTASTPLTMLTDDRNAILAVGMNGQPLPSEHGFPVRMVVPGLYGYVSATKWVVDLEVMRFGDKAAYWSTRGWSERGPIKLQSRIDVPRRGTMVGAGTTVIAGVAWHQHVGVSGVEVQIDDGAWQPATLATAISDDTWVQWMLPWTAGAGSHTIRCRATSADGTVQTPDAAPPAPDGATGWHTVDVTVA